MDLSNWNDYFLFVPVSVFIAGIIGSPHCAAMCGPIVVTFAKNPSRLFAYQVGRMLSYVVFGVIAGSLGSTLFGDGLPPWVSQIAIVFVATIMLFTGIRAFRGQPLHFPFPQKVSDMGNKIWKLIHKLNLRPMTFAGFAGVLTIFLPCGHLYTFLLGATTTGSALGGGVFMFAFWLGSAPLLSLGGHWLHKVMVSQNIRRQRWAGGLIVLAGMMTLSMMFIRSESFAQKLRDKKEIGLQSKPSIDPTPKVSCH